MTGAAIRAIDPLDRRPAARRGRELPAEGFHQLPAVAGRLHLRDAAGDAGPAGQQPAGAVRRCSGSGPSCSRSSTRRPTRWPGSSWRSTPTTSSSRRPRGCGPPPPSGSRPRRRSTRKGGSRSTATSTRSPSSPTRSPGRPSSRPPTTSRSSRWRRPRGRCSAYDNIAVAEGPQPAQGLHPGPRPAGRARPAADPARRPVSPEADQRPGQSRPGRPDAAPGSGPRRPPAAPAGPGRPARPAPHAAAAAGPRRRARYPLAGEARARRAGGGPRLGSGGAASTRSAPGPAPVARSRSTCPPCRRSDRDRTPDGRVLSRAGPSFRRGRPVSIPGQGRPHRRTASTSSLESSGFGLLPVSKLC